MTKLISILITGFFINLSMAQTVEGNIPNAQLIKTNNGYLVCGVEKSTIKIKLYDINLKLIHERSQPINEKINGVFAEITTVGYRFSTRYTRLDLNHNLEILNFKQWSKDEIKNAPYDSYSYSNLKNYTPLYMERNMSGKENEIIVDSVYIEILSKFKTPGRLNLAGKMYNGASRIRGFILNEEFGISTTYRNIWDKELDHQNIVDFKWYNFKNSNLYLYVSEIRDGKYESFIYSINSSSGEINYKFKVNDSYPNFTLAFSNLKEDNDRNIVIVGNYNEDDNFSATGGVSNIKHSAVPIYKGMDGWYMIKIDSKGNEIKKTTNKFDLHYSLDFKNTLFGESKLYKYCYSFRDIKIEDGGSISLICENIRLHTDTDRSTTEQFGGNNLSQRITSTTENEVWQSYGFDYFKLDKELKIINNIQKNELYVSKKFKKGYNAQINSTGENHGIFELVSGHPARPHTFLKLAMNEYSIEESFLDGESSVVLFKQLEPASHEYFYYYMFISGKKKGDKIFLKSTQTSIPPYYYFKSLTELIEFKQTDSGYSISIMAI